MKAKVTVFLLKPGIQQCCIGGLLDNNLTLSDHHASLTRRVAGTYNLYTFPHPYHSTSSPPSTVHTEDYNAHPQPLLSMGGLSCYQTNDSSEARVVCLFHECLHCWLQQREQDGLTYNIRQQYMTVWWHHMHQHSHQGIPTQITCHHFIQVFSKLLWDIEQERRVVQ